MNKQIFFLSGMFRCGTNLLRSIMNQNPNFYISPNSFLPEIFHLLHRTKETNQYKDWKRLDIDINYKDNEMYFDDIIKNTFNNYYSSYKQKYIMDQARWGAPGNYRLLMYYEFLPKKFVMLIRPFEDILKSWIRYYKVPQYRISKLCDDLMVEHGAIGQGMLALETLIQNQKSSHLKIISYDDFCNNPKKEIKELYKFLDIPYYKGHKFTNLKQVDTKGIKPSIVRTNKIEKINYKDDIVIPDNILQKYSKQINLLKNLIEIKSNDY